MVGNTEPPVVTDAELANLTYEQLAQLINEGNPNDFYVEASAFDEASGRLWQLRDDFVRESRLLQSYVSGEILVAVEEVTQRHVGRIDAVLEPMLHPGYAQGLRHAGDALATGQQRLRDLQSQNAQQDPAAPPPPPEAGEQKRLQALQILRDIGTAYQDIGSRFGPLPETVNNGNTFNVNTATTNGPGPGNTVLHVGGRFRQETATLKQDSNGNTNVGAELRADGSNVFVSGGGGSTAGGFVGASVVGGAFAAPLGRTADCPFETVVDSEALPATMVSAGVLSSGVLSSGVPLSGVLGRPAARTTVADQKDREKRTEVEAGEVLADQLPTLREAERPETVSMPPKENLVAEPVQTVSAEVAKPSFTIPAFDVRTELTATAGEGTVDPKERGMHVPASATSGGATELSAAQPGTFPMITPMAVPTTSPSAPTGASATGHGMGPMMPPMMMGGMRGGAGSQDGERFAEVPVTPDAEVWDPLRATGAVLGRPEPEPSETPEPCTEQEIDAVRQAAIDEILGKKG